jgi:hypothetical protein
MISFATKLHILLIMIVVGFGLYMFLLYKEVRIFQEEIDDMKIDIQFFKTQLGCPNANVKVLIDSHVSQADTINEQPIASSSLSHVSHVSRVSRVSHVQVNDVVQYDDDDESVTDDEIKSILTNIHDVTDCTDGTDDDTDVANVANVANVADVADVADADVTSTNANANASIKVNQTKVPKVKASKVVSDVAATATATATTTEATSTTASTVDMTTLSADELKSITYDDLRAFLRKRGHNIKGTKPDLIKKIVELSTVSVSDDLLVKDSDVVSIDADISVSIKTMPSAV